MELPGVAEAADRARDALGRAHRHRANLRGWPVTAAEAALRAARASSVLDGGPVRLDDLAEAARINDPVFGGALRRVAALGGGGGGRRPGGTGGRRPAASPGTGWPARGPILRLARVWSCWPGWSPAPRA